MNKSETTRGDSVLRPTTPIFDMLVAEAGLQWMDTQATKDAEPHAVTTSPVDQSSPAESMIASTRDDPTQSVSLDTPGHGEQGDNRHSNGWFSTEAFPAGDEREPTPADELVEADSAASPSAAAQLD